jgi:ABC-type uncharacterized transport system ATPase subunit
MRDIEDLAQRALLLDRGEIVAEGSPGELARRFSGARVLRVVFEQEVPEGELRRLGELEEFNGNEAVILVPAAKTKEAAQTLLECFSVHDLTIEEPDLEEALRTYFREAG